MYKIVGHTMGTPEYELEEAIDLFKEIHLDGIEIVCQEGYKSGIDPHAPVTFLKKILEKCKNLKLDIACLTPYLSKFNSPDSKTREEELKNLKNAIDVASYLECHFMRIYGGSRLVEKKEDNTPELLKQYLIESIIDACNYAEKKDVYLVIENHFNTLTETALQTVDIIKSIDHSHAGILYDQANLTFFYAEDYEDAINLQAPYIKYVHVKDLFFKLEDKRFEASSVFTVDKSKRNVYSRILGEGIIPWPKILSKLHEIGYRGYLSIEYERRWHAEDLPPAKEGMKKSAEYLRSLVKRLEL